MAHVRVTLRAHLGDPGRHQVVSPDPAVIVVARSGVQRVQSLLELVCMRTLSFCQRLKPVGDLVETFFAGSLGHAWVHVGVLMCFTGNGGTQVGVARADGHVGGWIADHSQVIEVAMGMTGLTLGGGAEQGCDFREAFHVGLVCEIQITAIGLRLAGEGGLEVVVGMGAS